MNYIDQAVHGNNPNCQGYQVEPIFWGRFRDDIYMPWIHGLEELMLFKEWINTIHPSLKFTFEYSENGVEFLDLFIYTKDSEIHTKLYSKKSYTHSYLVPSSCHKHHIIKNIPFNIARRVKQNNSETCNYNKDKELYTKYLKERGYNEKLIEESFVKVESMERQNLYSKKENSNQKQCSPIVIEDNPALPPMNKIINKHKYILELDEELKKIIPKDSIFVSYRSAKNVKDILISSKLKDPTVTVTVENGEDKGCYKCNKCYLCRWFLQETKTFTSMHTNQIFTINDKIDCNEKGIIYLIDCLKHECSYVGYTTTSMKTRFSTDKSHIKNSRHTCEIVTHMIVENHDLDFCNIHKYDESHSKSIRVTLIEKVNNLNPGDSIAVKEAKCERREAFWQRQLKTLRTYGGLNKRDGRKYYLT